MLSVNEQEYRNYQSGSKVYFRINKSDNNKIVRDLNKKNDIHNVRDYNNYLEEKNENHILSLRK